jgi:hypothetical protein
VLLHLFHQYGSDGGGEGHGADSPASVLGVADHPPVADPPNRALDAQAATAQDVGSAKSRGLTEPGPPEAPPELLQRA